MTETAPSAPHGTMRIYFQSDIDWRDAEIERLRGENAKLAMMSKDCANRTAVTSLAFLAKIVRDIGYENRKQESNAEMIGRALRELSDGGRRWMSAEGPQSS